MEAASIAAIWVDSVLAVGGDADAAVTSAAEMARRYDEPHRHYHDAAHILSVAADAAQLARELHVDEHAVLCLAACAHDVVYDGKPGDDERASAAWAAEALRGAAVDAPVADRVARLVLATIDHDAPADDIACQILLDADLAILGATPERYDAYVRAVRREYAAVPQNSWRVGRGAVVQQLLARDPLYRTRPARTRWEGAARENLRRELNALR